ncbi:MAG: PASTA domain-containing protein [Clostridia bacterium]|nr:PASTA domain-containing protein [Clostridia bacterium]
MSELRQLCMGCMREINANLRVCPHCGHDAGAQQHAPYLPKRTVLIGRYLVGKLTGITADSALYIGQDVSSGETVTVREFLPEPLVRRSEGQTALEVRMGSEPLFQQMMGSFESLWRAIMGLEDASALPQVKDIFFCNETVYAVTKYLDAITLRAYIEMPGKRLNWPGAFKSFRNVMLALSRLHSLGVVHAAISPSDLYVGADGKLHLDGFAIPQVKEGAGPLKLPPADGFAPLECYDPRMHIGPYTDIYALAASMLFGMTGRAPQSAPDRAIQDQLTLPPAVTTAMPPEAAKAMLSALQLYPQRRLHSIEQLLDALSPEEHTVQQDETTVRRASLPTPPKPIPVSTEGDVTVLVPPEPEKKESTPLWLAVKVFLIVAVSGGLLIGSLYGVLRYREKKKQGEVPTTPAIIETSVEDVAVPDFKKMTLSGIKNNAAYNRNFALKYEYEESSTVPKDAIIRQSVDANERVPKGTVITITVSSGPTMVLLQDVFGMPYDEALTILERDGFTVKRAVRENNGTHTPEEVCAMSRVAQIKYEKGTEVTLTVWGVYVPPPTTTEPPTEVPTESLPDASQASPAEEPTRPTESRETPPASGETD